ncbi:hypothetical protein [Marinifilum breve]|nr:hypothetical protein [Marinifilum breve]
MKILSVNESADNLTVQSVNGLMFIEEDWVREAKKNKNKQKKK